MDTLRPWLGAVVVRELNAVLSKKGDADLARKEKGSSATNDEEVVRIEINGDNDRSSRVVQLVEVCQMSLVLRLNATP